MTTVSDAFAVYEEDADEADAIRVAWEENAEREEMTPMTEEELARAEKYDREENGSQHYCEEASVLSRATYIPCRRPAYRLIKNRDPKPYWMCDDCAEHNISNRGAKEVALNGKENG